MDLSKVDIRVTQTNTGFTELLLYTNNGNGQPEQPLEASVTTPFVEERETKFENRKIVTMKLDVESTNFLEQLDRMIFETL